MALLPLGVLAGLVAVLVAGARTESSADPAARFAPAFSTADLRSPDKTLSFDGKPTRPTVVNFFASWCVPCKAELPLLGEAARERTGIDFIGIDVRDARNDALLMLEDANAGFPAGIDRDRRIAELFQLSGMPTTFFIAPGGRILATVQGELTEDELAEQLDRLEAA